MENEEIKTLCNEDERINALYDEEIKALYEETLDDEENKTLYEEEINTPDEINTSDNETENINTLDDENKEDENINKIMELYGITFRPEKVEIQKITKDKKNKESIIRITNNKTAYINKNLITRSKKDEALLEQVAFLNCANDTNEINYLENGIPNFKLEQIRPIFIDNIILFAPYILDLMEPIDKRKKINVVASNNYKLKNGLLGSLTKTTQEIFKLFGFDIKKPKIKPTTLHKQNKNNNFLGWKNGDLLASVFLRHYPEKRNNIKNITEKEKQEELYLQLIKIDLGEQDGEKIIKLLNNPEFFKALSDNLIFINDYDATTDFYGSVNTEKLKLDLLQNGFRMQGKNLDTTDKTILDNAHFVGRNCISFMYNGCRYKIYNKFVQALESRTVRSTVGNNLKEWINNPCKELEKTIAQSLNNGFTRLEITHYINGDHNKILPINEIKKNINYLHEIINKENIYDCTIKTQWENLASTLKETLLIYNYSKNNLFVCYWLNKLTKKINGTHYKNIKQSELGDIIKYYTFSAPISIITLEEEEKTERITTKNKITEKLEQYLYIQKKDYCKINKTILPDVTILHKYRKKQNNKPEQRGITPHKNINFVIVNGLKDVHKINYDIEPLNNLNVLYLDNNKYRVVKKPERKIELFYESAEKIKTKIEHKKAIVEIINKEMQQQREAKNKEHEYKQQLAKKFLDLQSQITKSERHKLIDLQDGEILKINTIREIATKYGPTYLLYDRKRNAVYYSIKPINNYIIKIKAKLFLKESLLFITNFANFLEIKKTGHRLIAGHKTATIIIKSNLGPVQQQEEQQKQQEEQKQEQQKQEQEQKQEQQKNICKTMPNYIKLCDAQSVNELEENITYVITGFLKSTGKINRYFMQIEELNNELEIVKNLGYYYSNSFLLEEIEKLKSLEHYIYIIAGCKKTNKIFKKDRVFSVV